jgi:ribosomal protein S18 acetylase RimI-like enzyme
MTAGRVRNRYRRRAYEGPAALRTMQSLTQRLWSPASRWHIGELAWARFQHVGREPEWRTALWEHGGEPVAWAWASAPGELDLHLDPAHPDLAAEILRWFDEVTTAETRTVTVLNAETALIRELRGHGYDEVTEGPFFVRLRRDLADLPEPEVADGYILRHVSGTADADARARVHRAVFSLPGGPPSKVTGESYRGVMRAWPYRPELDWLVEAADGTPVAFCLVWLDEHNRAAVLEPVGTDPGHRRRGLARAAILASLRAARELGAETAHVCARGDAAHSAALATYEAVAFHPYARDLSFARDN